MKITQLFQAMLVSSFVAVPCVAAALPAVAPNAPIPLCGENKTDKAESAQQDDKRSEKKDANKNDKKQVKDEKSAGKGSV